MHALPKYVKESKPNNNNFSFPKTDWKTTSKDGYLNVAVFHIIWP